MYISYTFFEIRHLVFMVFMMLERIKVCSHISDFCNEKKDKTIINTIYFMLRIQIQIRKTIEIFCLIIKN